MTDWLIDWLITWRLQRGLEEEKDLLFDRIADSYVALFTSINADVKDKFLSVSHFAAGLLQWEKNRDSSIDQFQRTS